MPELNLGQLRMIVRSQFLIDVIGINQMNTKPFSVSDLTARVEEILDTAKVAEKV